MSYVYPLMPSDMTLRDWFAAKAMQSALNHAKVDMPSAYQIMFAEVALRSYQAADAMLKARDA